MSLIEHLEHDGWEEFFRGSFGYALEVMKHDRFRSVGSSVDDLRIWLAREGSSPPGQAPVDAVLVGSFSSAPGDLFASVAVPSKRSVKSCRSSIKWSRASICSSSSRVFRMSASTPERRSFVNNSRISPRRFARGRSTNTPPAVMKNATATTMPAMLGSSGYISRYPPAHGFPTAVSIDDGICCAACWSRSSAAPVTRSAESGRSATGMLYAWKNRSGTA